MKCRLSSLQTPRRPSACGRLCVQPQLAAPHLLPVRGDLRRPADAGRRGSLPAALQPQSGRTRPQPDREFTGSQSLRPALILQQPHQRHTRGSGNCQKNQKLSKCFYIVFTLQSFWYNVNILKMSTVCFRCQLWCHVCVFLHSTSSWRSFLCLFTSSDLPAHTNYIIVFVFF